jgi:hypothetical protein
MSELCNFVADLLESEGSVVELDEPDGLDVIAPDTLRDAYGWPELARLGFGPAAPPDAIPLASKAIGSSGSERCLADGDGLQRDGSLCRRGPRRQAIPSA